MSCYPSIPVLSNDIFKIFHIFLFAMMNGFCTTVCMILAPEDVSDNEKETAGFIMPFALFFGIMIGSLIAIPFAAIKNWLSL